MFISAKAYFNNQTPEFTRLLIRASTALPYEFAKRYRKNVVKITPMKSGALRRSIITQVTDGQADIGWRSRYAYSQNVGRHPLTGEPYKNYTTPGTGPGFASKAYKQTMAEMPAVLRELGLTK